MFIRSSNIQAGFNLEHIHSGNFVVSSTEIDVVTGIIPPSYELPDEGEPLLEGGNA